MYRDGFEHNYYNIYVKEGIIVIGPNCGYGNSVSSKLELKAPPHLIEDHVVNLDTSDSKLTTGKISLHRVQGYGFCAPSRSRCRRDLNGIPGCTQFISEGRW
jgi:hypothetical protein